MTADLPAPALFWLVAVNIAAFLAFGLDKRLSETDARRIPESTLLSLALAGGSMGAVFGQQFFRHKTQKEPFRSRLYGIVVLQVIVVGVWLGKPDLLSTLAG